MTGRDILCAAVGLALALAAAACAGDGDGASDDVLELETPDLDVASGADITYCTYIEQTVAEDRDILSFEGTQTQYGHHTILYGARSKQEPGTHVCTEADMINARYLAAGGSETGSFAVPDGIAFRLHAGQQLMIQSHFINASDHDAVGRSSFRVDTALPDLSRQPADLFTVVTTEIDVAAHAEAAPAPSARSGTTSRSSRSAATPTSGAGGSRSAARPRRTTRWRCSTTSRGTRTACSTRSSTATRSNSR